MTIFFVRASSLPAQPPLMSLLEKSVLARNGEAFGGRKRTQIETAGAACAAAKKGKV